MVERVAGESAAVSIEANSPLKLLTPRARGLSVWSYLSSFGGGLVAGDETSLSLRVGSGARCFLGTQASAKIYRNPRSLPCSHRLDARVESGAILVLAPDPVQGFAGSIYLQRQEFRMAPGAGLAMVDWFSSGRSARGERWAFGRFQGRNEVFIGDDRLLLDSILLDPADGRLDGPHRLGRFNCFATILLLGLPFRQAASRLLAESADAPVKRRDSLTLSVSPLGDGALARIASEEVETAALEVRRILTVAAGVLGDDPWAHRW